MNSSENKRFQESRSERLYAAHSKSESANASFTWAKVNRHEINESNPPVIERSSEHLPTDVRWEANVGYRRFSLTVVNVATFPALTPLLQVEPDPPLVSVVAGSGSP